MKPRQTIICPFHRKPKRLELIHVVTEEHKQWYTDYYRRKCRCGRSYQLEATGEYKDLDIIKEK